MRGTNSGAIFSADAILLRQGYGGTGKAGLVEEGEHLGTLIDFVHLNPYRAGLVPVKEGLESYPWSSLTDYSLPPRKRSGWVEVTRGLARKEIVNDNAASRRRDFEHLEGVARERDGVPALPEGEQRTLQSTLRRGWYFGAEEFRDKMVEKLEELKGKDGKGHRRRSGYNGAQARDHGEAEGKRVLKAGLAAAGLCPADLPGLKKRDWRKRVIGRLIRKRTVMPVAWIAETLCMGQPNGAATLLRHDPSRAQWRADWKQGKKLMKQLQKELRI